jgi:hypothetical protein
MRTNRRITRWLKGSSFCCQLCSYLRIISQGGAVMFLWIRNLAASKSFSAVPAFEAGEASGSTNIALNEG